MLQIIELLYVVSKFFYSLKSFPQSKKVDLRVSKWINKLLIMKFYVVV